MKSDDPGAARSAQDRGRGAAGSGAARSSAMFRRRGEVEFVASGVTRGPWDTNAQHGGAAAALLMHAFERLPAANGLEIARVTCEFLRPVPLGSLMIQAEVARPGGRVQLLEASLFSPAGAEVVRARALQVQRARDVPPEVFAQDIVPPGPERGRTNDYPAPEHSMFAIDGVEIRFVAGSFMDPGPSSAWFRLRVPVIEGSETTPLQRLSAAADFGNGISSVVPWGDYRFINPDLTLYVERPPVGEWICLESSTRIADGGVAISESRLYDERGRVGRAIQSLLVTRR